LEAIRQIVRISEDREIKIKVPQYLLKNEIVEVILLIKKRSDNFDQKIDELRDAMKDELFLRDLKEVSEDFDTIDLNVLVAQLS
jgi:hypothetical protein